MENKLRAHQAILIGVFFLLLLTPLITKLTGLEYKTKLYNIAIASKPDFSLENYWRGDYQDAFDSYYSTNLGDYSAMAKLYTQLRYDLFSVCTGYKLTGYNVVLKNDAFLEEAYINNFLQTEDATALTPAQLPEFVDCWANCALYRYSGTN